MTVELITGYSGTPHIGSDDVQHLIAGIVGGGSYALDTGKGLAIAVNSANSVTIDTGDAIIAGGAHVRVAAAEKLTVTSGAQGVKRNDLVCLRYTKASDNKESAALVVVKGTATSGTPADPAVNTGSIINGKATVDMPLYRLPISGVSLGTPVKLFSVSPTLASLGDSVSHAKEVVLYDNPSGTNGNVTLKETSANFEHIDVFAGKLDGYNGGYTSVRLYAPNGKRGTVLVPVYVSNGNVLQLAWAKFLVSGATIYQEANGAINFDGHGISYFDPGERKTLIYRVVGHRA